MPALPLPRATRSGVGKSQATNVTQPPQSEQVKKKAKTKGKAKGKQARDPSSSPNYQPTHVTLPAFVHNPAGCFPKHLLKKLPAPFIAMIRSDIPSWLFPHLKTVEDVTGDGHCGFRAISLALGIPQDGHIAIRHGLLNEVRNNADYYTDKWLDDAWLGSRDKVITSLDTVAPEVLQQVHLWLKMPQMAPIIANTFQRPVIYISRAGCNTIFPFKCPKNDLEPIILAYLPSARHFVRMTLDHNNSDTPLPLVCTRWHRFASPEARSWLQRFPAECFSAYTTLSGVKEPEEKLKIRLRLK